MNSFLIENISAISIGSAVVLLVLLVFVPLVVCAARRKSFGRTWLLTWLGLSTCGILMSLVLPITLSHIADNLMVSDYFPDSPGAFGFGVVGAAFPAAILTVVVKSLIEFLFSRRIKKAPQPSQ